MVGAKQSVAKQSVKSTAKSFSPKSPSRTKIGGTTPRPSASWAADLLRAQGCQVHLPTPSACTGTAGLDETGRPVVYYCALLVNVGCHSDAPNRPDGSGRHRYEVHQVGPRSRSCRGRRPCSRGRSGPRGVRCDNLHIGSPDLWVNIRGRLPQFPRCYAFRFIESRATTSIVSPLAHPPRSRCSGPLSYGARLKDGAQCAAVSSSNEPDVHAGDSQDQIFEI